MQMAQTNKQDTYVKYGTVIKHIYPEPEAHYDC